MSKATKERQRRTTDNGAVGQSVWPEEVSAVATPPLLKLDFGAGPSPREGFEGVDKLPFGGKVKHVVNLCERAGGSRSPDSNFVMWPWPDSSVAEAHASHFLEHLTNLDDRWERVHFFNELYRVLVPGGQCQIIIPHWCSNRYYGDPTHKEPFSEFGFLYLSKAWRLGDPDKGIPGNAPHDDVSHNPKMYSCDFLFTSAYTIHPALGVRSQEYVQHAVDWWKEAAQDLMATLTSQKKA